VEKCEDSKCHLCSKQQDVMQSTITYNIETTKLVSVLEAIQLHKSKFRAHYPRTVAQLHCFRTSLSMQWCIARSGYTDPSYPKIRELYNTLLSIWLHVHLIII